MNGMRWKKKANIGVNGVATLTSKHQQLARDIRRIDHSLRRLISTHPPDPLLAHVNIDKDTSTKSRKR